MIGMLPVERIRVHVAFPVDLCVDLCRTAVLADRRKLCRIAHQHESAALAGIDVMHQIVEQTTGSKDSIVVGIIRNHRRFVHYEQSILLKVDVVLKDIHIRD